MSNTPKTSDQCFFSHTYTDGHTLQLLLTADNSVKYRVIKDGKAIENICFRIIFKDGTRLDPSNKAFSQRLMEDPSIVQIRDFDPTLAQVEMVAQLKAGTKTYIGKQKADSQEIKEAYECGFLHVAPLERRTSTTPVPEEPTFTALTSTRLLALTIRMLADKKDKTLTKSVHDDLVRFARSSIMKAFEDYKPKSARIYEELTELTLSHNKEICQDVLEKIFSELKNATFKNGNIDILEALQDVLKTTDPAFFDANQLLEILKKISELTAHLHVQYETLPEFQTLIDTLTSILVTMAEAGVHDVSYKDTHDPLYQFLDKVSKDSRLSIFTCKKARLALEALKRISHDKSDLEIAFDRLIAAAKAANYIAYAIANKYYINCFDALEQLKIAGHKQGKKKIWYDHYRYLDYIIKAGQWGRVESVLEKAIKGISKSEYTHMMPLVIYSLNQVISSDLQRTEDRLEACKILYNLYLLDSKYSLSKVVFKDFAFGDDIRHKTHVEILRQLKTYARWETNKQLRDLARDKLELIMTKKLRGTTEEGWFKEVGISPGMDWDALSLVQPRPLKFNERTHDLLTAAKKLKLDVGATVRQLQLEHGNKDAPHVKARLDTFGDLLATDAATGKTVFVKEELLKWLPSAEKVALVESVKGGAGKTTIVKVMHHEAWKMAKAKTVQDDTGKEQVSKVIIAEIRADSIKNSPKGAVSNALVQLGFARESFPEMYKDYCIVLLCDELDALDIQANFFTANKEWKNLKIMYTGRKAHLPQTSAELLSRLNPPDVTTPFLHLKLQHFESATSMETFAKYVEHHPQAPRKLETEPGKFPYAAWTFSKYEEYFKLHPEVRKMILHPSTLVSVFKGLPFHVEASKDKTDKEVLPIDFIKFEINEAAAYERSRISRIVSDSSNPEIAKKYKIVGDFINNFDTFSKEFTALVASLGRTSIAYQESIEEDDSEVGKVLGDPKKLMYRETCLILNEKGEYQLHEERFHNYWLQQIIADGLKMAMQKKTEPQPSPVLKQEQRARVFSTRPLEDSVTKLLAQTVSRDSTIEPLLKEFEEDWTARKRNQIRGINSQKVLHALAQMKVSDEVYADYEVTDGKEPEEEYV